MRTALVGLGCLVGGALGALGYSHYLGEGKQLADLQVQISEKDAALAKVTKNSEEAKTETDAMSAQIQQLTATKQDLQHEVESLKNAPPPAAPAAPGFPGLTASMTEMVNAQLSSKEQEKFQRLVKRLNLTDDQQAALKAAMDAEDKRTEEMSSKFMANGKIDPAEVAAEMKGTKSTDQTLKEILTPEQKATYEQMKTDERNNTAEASASMEMNQMATSLNLTDAQRDQVGSALYQAELNVPHVSNSSDPTAFLDEQAKAKEDALAKVLTPDQLATYHQQAQSQLAFQKSIMQKFLPAAKAAAPASAPANP
jgi:Spy/CpxP family protein refolding chaperone